MAKAKAQAKTKSNDDDVSDDDDGDGDGEQDLGPFDGRHPLFCTGARHWVRWHGQGLADVAQRAGGRR
eukprot:7202564-Lingulodinium_polyedra.AAC.1